MSVTSPGFFGKVPALGDFVTRRLPPGFGPRWDTWLGLLTSSVRDAAGDAWPEAWLTAPLWHFVLGAGLAPATGAAGVLVASADRVGRFYPFTIIGPAQGTPPDEWSAAVEDLVLDALGDGFQPEILDAALLQLGPPAAGQPVAPGASVWWCRGSDRVEPVHMTLAGLPDAAQATAMVLGSA